MKRVKLQSNDGDTFEIEPDMISMCTTVKNMLRGKTAFRNSLGGQFSIDGSYVILKKEGRVLASLTKNTDEEAIITLPDVKSSTLEKVIDYCKFHAASANASEREKRNWDAEFVQVKQSVLCELASASYYLDIKPLVNLTSRAIATQISGKTSEEIRETFCNLNDVYAPLFATTLATRCRLQRKINRKKQEEKDAKSAAPIDDSRSVDDLLSFINEDASNSKKKKKKKKQVKSKQLEESSAPNSLRDDNKRESSDHEADRSDNSSLSTSSTAHEEDGEEQEMTQRDSDKDDEVTADGSEERDEDIDPELQAQLDKEVEEFRQRLELMNTEKRDTPKIPLPMSAASFVSSLVGVH